MDHWCWSRSTLDGRPAAAGTATSTASTASVALAMVALLLLFDTSHSLPPVAKLFQMAKIRQKLIHYVISRFSLLQQIYMQHFRFCWLHIVLMLHIQNLSNCCSYKYDQSISRFFFLFNFWRDFAIWPNRVLLQASANWHYWKTLFALSHCLIPH